MDQDVAVQELAEELRVNTRLRHRLGMEEGIGSGEVKTDESEVSQLYFDTADGKTFAIGVVEVVAE